jgi:hypothetical protein
VQPRQAWLLLVLLPLLLVSVLLWLERGSGQEGVQGLEGHAQPAGAGRGAGG